MFQRPFHPPQQFVHRLQSKLFGVKLPTSPTTEMAELLMPRLEDDLQEFLVAKRSSNILRWAPTFTSEAKRRRGRGNGGNDLLHHNLMPPIVTEIVHVNHRV